eukprot:2580907-Prymnesium_polylepis.1
MTRPPDLIVVLDNTNLLGEPNKLNIPVRAGAPPSARQLPCGARHGRAPALHVAPSSQSLPERPSPAHAARFSRAHAPRRHRDTPTTPIRRRPLSPRSPRRQHAKVVGVVDTDSPQEGIDYPIIANTKSLRFYHTFAHMLVRTIKEGQQLRDDLDKYEIVSRMRATRARARHRRLRSRHQHHATADAMAVASIVAGRIGVRMRAGAAAQSAAVWGGIGGGGVALRADLRSLHNGQLEVCEPFP